MLGQLLVERCAGDAQAPRGLQAVAPGGAQGFADRLALDPGDAENAPDYRVHLDDEDGPEVGGAWKRVGERAGDYIALEIDSPLFLPPFRPVLFCADDDGRTFRLSWKRPRSRDERN